MALAIISAEMWLAVGAVFVSGLATIITLIANSGVRKSVAFRNDAEAQEAISTAYHQSLIDLRGEVDSLRKEKRDLRVEVDRLSDIVTQVQEKLIRYEEDIAAEQKVVRKQTELIAELTVKLKWLEGQFEKIIGYIPQYPMTENQAEIEATKAKLRKESKK